MALVCACGGPQSERRSDDVEPVFLYASDDPAFRASLAAPPSLGERPAWLEQVVFRRPDEPWVYAVGHAPPMCNSHLLFSTAENRARARFVEWRDAALVQAVRARLSTPAGKTAISMDSSSVSGQVHGAQAVAAYVDEAGAYVLMRFQAEAQGLPAASTTGGVPLHLARLHAPRACPERVDPACEIDPPWTGLDYQARAADLDERLARCGAGLDGERRQAWERERDLALRLAAGWTEFSQRPRAKSEFIDLWLSLPTHDPAEVDRVFEALVRGDAEVALVAESLLPARVVVAQVLGGPEGAAAQLERALQPGGAPNRPRSTLAVTATLGPESPVALAACHWFDEAQGVRRVWHSHAPRDVDSIDGLAAAIRAALRVELVALARGAAPG